jgi:hypothetical protein
MPHATTKLDQVRIAHGMMVFARLGPDPLAVAVIDSIVQGGPLCLTVTKALGLLDCVH